jgi:hypothetical protein
MARKYPTVVQPAKPKTPPAVPAPPPPPSKLPSKPCTGVCLIVSIRRREGYHAEGRFATGFGNQNKQ